MNVLVNIFKFQGKNMKKILDKIKKKCYNIVKIKKGGNKNGFF